MVTGQLKLHANWGKTKFENLSFFYELFISWTIKFIAIYHFFYFMMQGTFHAVNFVL